MLRYLSIDCIKTNRKKESGMFVEPTQMIIKVMVLIPKVTELKIH